MQEKCYPQIDLEREHQASLWASILCVISPWHLKKSLLLIEKKDYFPHFKPENFCKIVFRINEVENPVEMIKANYSSNTIYDDV